MEIKEQEQYLEKLLEWCNDIHSNWESMKPRFSKQFDLRSLEEWEESYHELKGRLQADLKKDFDHFKELKTCMISGIYFMRNRMLPKKKLNYQIPKVNIKFQRKQVKP